MMNEGNWSALLEEMATDNIRKKSQKKQIRNHQQQGGQ